MAKFTEQDLQKAIEAGIFDCFNNTTATPATVIRFFEAWATERENEIRQTFADYRRAEGCSCCRNVENHKAAENKMAELLSPEPYDDGSGFDWGKYESK